jgi:hypothetical protein
LAWIERDGLRDLMQHSRLIAQFQRFGTRTKPCAISAFQS